MDPQDPISMIFPAMEKPNKANSADPKSRDIRRSSIHLEMAGAYREAKGMCTGIFVLTD